MKCLITGFQPFGEESMNPAYEAVKMLPDTIKGLEIIKLELPTVFVKAAEEMRAIIREERPSFVICVGQAGGRSAVTVEKIAINLKDAGIPDNEGNQPLDEKIKEDGENAYFSSLPVKAMVTKMNENGIPAALSYTAGTYVCNELMYQLLYMLDREFTGIRGGFIHVPFAPAQAVGKPGIVPSMSLEDISRSLHLAIEAVLENEADIPAPMGATH